MGGTELAGPAVTPVAKGARIESLDILRGVAVLGILIMNITAFGLLLPAYFNPLADGGATGANLRVFEIVTVAFEGTMRGLFSLLFGAGIVLMTGRMEKAGAGIMAADIHFRRMTWLLVFGVVHWSLLLWFGEILMAYALCGLLLFAPRNLAPRTQLALAGAMLAAAVVYAQFGHADTMASKAAYAEARAAEGAGAELDRQQEAAIEDWEERIAENSVDAGTEAFFVGYHEGSWWNAVKTQFELSFDFQWGGWPEFAFFDMLPFMLIGMALLKLGLLSGAASSRICLAMIVVGYGVGVPLGIHEVRLLEADAFGPVGMAEAERTYQISRLAMLAGHLGLLLLVIRRGLFATIQRGLAAVGQMALTNYVMQTVICTALFYGFGFGLYRAFERHELYYVVGAIWAVELAWSVLWLKRFRFGPLEWAWRSLTYWQRQPMRRGPPAAPAAGEAPAAA